jgi:hypothetical protein
MAKTDVEQQGVQSSGTAAPQDVAANLTVKWDDSNMKSSYANVCNVTSTREEMVLLFGINQSWHRGGNEVTVQLTDRIILSPFAAKRLMRLLGDVVQAYEGRFGSLPDVQPQPQPPTPSSPSTN